MKNILVLTILFTLFPLSVFAQEKETSVSELFAPGEVKAEEIENLDEIEQERKEQIENQLGFTIPEYTDNPSYTITFTDPSPEKSGVEISTDGKDFVRIESPYTFPSLGIGQHALRFRFNDKDNNVQILEYTMIVLPRSPIIQPPVLRQDSINITGTGLANSEILLFLSSNTYNYTQIVDIDGDGKWSTTVTPEEGLADGIYTVTALTRKGGFVSELAKATVFEVGDSNDTKKEKEEENIFFSFASLTSSDIKDVINRNPDLVLLCVIPFVLGIFLTLLFKVIFRNKKDDVNIKRVEESMKKNSNPNGEKTLRELFEQKDDVKKEEKKPEEGKKVVEKKEQLEKKEEVKKEEEPKEKVLSKEEFLKEYKVADPDDNKGKERPSPKINKDIKISLTSREE